MNSYKYKLSKYKNKLQFLKTIVSMVGGGLCVSCGKPADIYYIPCKHNTICRLCFEKNVKSHKEKLENMKIEGKPITTDDEKIKCEMCRTQIENVNLLNCENMLINIENDQYDGEHYIIPEPLDMFIYSLLKEDEYIDDINKIMDYISSTKLNEIKAEIKQILKSYILLLIAIEKKKEEIADDTSNLKLQTDLKELQIETTNFKEMCDYLNLKYKQELEEKVYTDVKTIDPQNLMKRDEIVVLNMTIDEIIQGLKDPKGNNSNYDRDNILKIFDCRPTPEAIDLRNTAELDEAITELRNLNNMTRYGMNIIELYYWMYYQGEYSRLNYSRFPRLDLNTLQQLFDLASYFVTRYINTTIDKEQNPSAQNILRDQLETYEAYKMSVIINGPQDIFGTMNDMIYPFIISL